MRVCRLSQGSGKRKTGSWIPMPRGMGKPFIEQVTMFPYAAYDDMADAMSQAASWLVKTSGSRYTMSNAFSGENHLTGIER